LRGGFKEEDIAVIGDVFHIQKRIYGEADTRHPQYSHFVGDVRKAFGSSETGVFWEGTKIISKLEEVKERWEKVGESQDNRCVRKAKDSYYELFIITTTVPSICIG
jgi:hypothetical protein